MSKRVLMQGNEAIVEGALAAGCRFFAGYPITPSTEIAEQAALRLPQVGGRFIQMEDEISSMAAVIGASVAGVKSMTATSGPGFSLKQENLGYASLTEVPCVVVDVQRVGPSTGLPTSPSQGDYMQARWGCHGDHPVIVLSPGSVSEAYSLTIKTFNLSEKYRVPVIFLTDEMIGHLRESIELPDESQIEIINRPVDPEMDGHFSYAVPEGEWVPQMPPFGEGTHYHITGLFHRTDGFPSGSPEIYNNLMRRLLDKVKNNSQDIIFYEEYQMEDAEIVVTCFGGTTGAAKEAINEARKKGIKAGLFRPITLWPFPDEAFKKAAEGAKRIIVVEHNDGQMLQDIQRLANCPIDFIGRVNGTVIQPEDILKKMEEK